MRIWRIAIAWVACSRQLSSTDGARLDSSSTPAPTDLRGLRRAGAEIIVVHGVTGFAESLAARVASLRTGSIELLERQMPVLAGSVYADAGGILGVEGPQDSRIEVDFEYDRVAVQRSTRKRASSGYLVVTAQLERGGLLLVRGRAGRIRVRVIVDTGAERSIGNWRLKEALERCLRKGGWVESIVSGATLGDVVADAFRSPPITIGKARLRGLTATFGDLQVFLSRMGTDWGAGPVGRHRRHWLARAARG